MYSEKEEQAQGRKNAKKQASTQQHRRTKTGLCLLVVSFFVCLCDFLACWVELFRGSCSPASLCFCFFPLLSVHSCCLS